jgi:hypothetical protein
VVVAVAEPSSVLASTAAVWLMGEKRNEAGVISMIPKKIIVITPHTAARTEAIESGFIAVYYDEKKWGTNSLIIIPVLILRKKRCKEKTCRNEFRQGVDRPRESYLVCHVFLQSVLRKISLFQRRSTIGESRPAMPGAGPWTGAGSRIKVVRVALVAGFGIDVEAARMSICSV